MTLRRSRYRFLFTGLPGALLGAVLGSAGCARQAPRPPILLITLGGLRADVVGGLAGDKVHAGLDGSTPNLDRLIADSTWAGHAISTTSSNAPAAASVLTGLRLWQHGLLNPGGALPRRFVTLPEALKPLGYHCAGFTGGGNLRRANGVARGFDSFVAGSAATADAEIAARLRTAEPFFIWKDFDLASDGYRREDRFLRRLADTPADLPAEVSAAEIATYQDPAVPMPAPLRARFWALYRSGVARADDEIGGLVGALRAAGRYDDALIVVVSEHGEAFGEDGEAGHGGGLGRALVDVPMIVKLPHRGGTPESRLTIPPAERVSIARVFATVLKAAGGEPPPGVAPDLAIRDRRGALSELYIDNGLNTTSLAQGDLRLLRSVRFAPAEPEYFRARREQLGDASAALSEPAEAILGRLTRAFRTHLPFTGAEEAPSFRLERWLPDGRVEAVIDASVEQRMAGELERVFFAFVPEELTPAEAFRRR